MAIITSKYDVNDVVFMNTGKGVVRGTICSIGIDMSKCQKSNKFALVYLIWVSDRKDNAGFHERCYEHNLGSSFEEAYYDADAKLPWNIMDDIDKKDFKQFFKNRDPVTMGCK